MPDPAEEDIERRLLIALKGMLAVMIFIDVVLGFYILELIL